MLTSWSDIDDFVRVDDFRRRMERLFDEVDSGRRPAERAHAAGWPRVNVFDTGAALVVKAEVPGLADKDVRITLNQDVLSFEGERKVDAPPGYAVHRQERGKLQFTRSFTLPCHVDPEKASATVKDGVLTITLTKAADAQPRQIAVKAQ